MARRPQLRVLAGALAGRRLAVAAGVRPTEARVREALFAIWQDRCPQCRFLDLFAGSGAVGLEALSRGASRVWLVESAPRVLAVLGRNCEGLPPRRVEIVRGSLPKALARIPPEGIDLIFADPPYGFTDWEPLLLAAAAHARPGTEMAVEHSARTAPGDELGGWRRLSERRYGETRVSFYHPTRPGGRVG